MCIYICICIYTHAHISTFIHAYLMEVEEQGHVASNTLLLQHLSCFDALVGRSDLDQNAMIYTWCDVT